MNYLALIVAALVPMALGFVWYHPKVFGNAWQKSAGLTDEQVKGGNMLLIFGLSFLFSLMLAYGLNVYGTHDAFTYGATYYATGGTMQPEAGSELAKWVEYFNTNLAPANHNFNHGAVHGFLIGGLLTALPIMATNALFERKSFKYVAINVGYWLVCLIIVGGIVAAWR